LINRIFEESPQTTSFIMDSEIVAIDPADGSLKSFQELSNRARKGVKLQNVTIMVGVFAFDLMYLDGEVIHLPLGGLLCVLTVRIWIRDTHSATFQPPKTSFTITIPSIQSGRCLSI
jgi:hypothetical protein